MACARWAITLAFTLLVFRHGPAWAGDPETWFSRFRNELHELVAFSQEAGKAEEGLSRS